MQPHDYWQTIHPPGSFDPAGPHRDSFPAGMPEGGQMLLPIRSHTRYVPFGTSRKFWYLDELSVPMSSITTPHQQKRLFADPRMLPLLKGRRVVLVDDVMSSGASMVAGLKLLVALDIEPVALAVAMLQTERWRSALSACGEGWPEKTRSVIVTPLLERDSEGLWKATA